MARQGAGGRQVDELDKQIWQSEATSFAGLLGQLELFREEAGGEWFYWIDPIIGGAKRLAGRGGEQPQPRMTEAEQAVASDTDGQILALFREWLAAHRSLAILPRGATDEQFKAACLVISDIKFAVMAVPATGAQGLAIKTYIHFHWDAGASAPGTLGSVDRLQRSILKDAIRFVPELAPLAAAALAAEGDKGGDDEPDVIGFGEPEGGAA